MFQEYRKQIWMCCWILMDFKSFVFADDTPALQMNLSAKPSAIIAPYEPLQLQCQISSPTLTPLTSACRFIWMRAHLPARESPRIDLISNEIISIDTVLKGVRIYEVTSPDGLPSKSVLFIPSVNSEMAGSYRCMLACPNPHTVLAQKSIQIDIEQGSVGLWHKRDISMMMVSMFVVIFVISMLMVGLILHIRRIIRRRQFYLQQQNRMHHAGIVTPKQTRKPPPKYSEIMQDNVCNVYNDNCDGPINERNGILKAVNSSSSKSKDLMNKLSPKSLKLKKDKNQKRNFKQEGLNNNNNNTSCLWSMSKHKELHRSESQHGLCEEENSDGVDERTLHHQDSCSSDSLDNISMTDDSLYTLTDHADCGNFDSVVLSIMPPTPSHSSKCKLPNISHIQEVNIDPTKLQNTPYSNI